MYCIEVKSLGKKYKRYSNHSSRLLEWITGKKLHSEKWVLKDLSFNVKAGESIGIIGHNGAGKSTLLKLLTGTISPTEGVYKVQGRIAALLELGMGFHPDFTGIQNVYMSCQLMGLSNSEIANLLPEIERFAEIGDYIHEPLRTFSSGMSVRLAFATATAVRPDILIVDEALSVGDVYFQHKCFDRIRKYREEGTTILFVSHDPGAVKNLCDKAILLDQGILIKEGLPEEILDYYNAIIAKREVDYQIKQSIGEGNRINTRSGNGELEISSVHLFLGNREVYAVQTGDVTKLDINIRANSRVMNPTIGFVIKDRLGNEVYGTNTYHLNQELGLLETGKSYAVSFAIPMNLGVGNYSVTVAAHSGKEHLEKNYDWWDHAITFQVIRGKQFLFDGLCFLPTSVSVKEKYETFEVK